MSCVLWHHGLFSFLEGLLTWSRLVWDVPPLLALVFIRREQQGLDLPAQLVLTVSAPRFTYWWGQAGQLEGLAEEPTQQLSLLLQT